eukprot:7208041-Prymnesium_polylepis.1
MFPALFLLSALGLDMTDDFATMKAKEAWYFYLPDFENDDKTGFSGATWLEGYGFVVERAGIGWIFGGWYVNNFIPQ